LSIDAAHVRPIAALVLVALGLVLSACGSGGGAPRPSAPVPASPTSASSDQFKGQGARTIAVFLKDAVTAAQRDAMARRIAAMPEVEVYAYVSKAQAVQQYKDMAGKEALRILQELPKNPLPASFRILVKDKSQVRAVAKRFYGDPAVENAPGTHDGVVFSPF